MQPNDYIKSLTIGVDVDWLKTREGRATYHQAKDAGISFPKMFKERGFDHVRLRVKDYGLGDLLPEIGVVIDDCLDVGLTPILAFQAQRFKDNPCVMTRDELITWWEFVAIALKDKSDRLAFNLIIETTDGLLQNYEALNDFYALASPRLREINPERVLIICPCRISAPERLPLLEVPEGCAVESHFYASGQSPTNPAKLWTDGNPDERQLILNKIALIADWRKATEIQVWVGAIMFSDYNSDDGDDSTSSYTVEEQVIFASFVNQSMRQQNIPYAANSDTKFFDRAAGQWKKEQEPVVDAILTQLP